MECLCVFNLCLVCASGRRFCFILNQRKLLEVDQQIVSAWHTCWYFNTYMRGATLTVRVGHECSRGQTQNKDPTFSPEVQKFLLKNCERDKKIESGNKSEDWTEQKRILRALGAGNEMYKQKVWVCSREEFSLMSAKWGRWIFAHISTRAKKE